MLVSTAVVRSVTDHIPLAAMLAKIPGGLSLPQTSSSWWAVIFSSNPGGNITPIGSASTLGAVTRMHKNRSSLSIAISVKAAIPFALAQIMLAVLYLLVFA